MKRFIQRFPYTTILCVLLIGFFLLIRFYDLTPLIVALSALSFFGVVIAGMFFVSIFTVVPAVFVLSKLVLVFPLWQVALFGGLGAMIGDYLIFRFFRDYVFEELSAPFLRLGGKRLIDLIDTKRLQWIHTVIGALIIASPFPDEIGVAFLGISRISKWRFLLLTFVLDAVGIYLLLVAFS